MHTVLELQGISCGGLEEVKPKQSIMSSRSFGHMQTEFASLAESISMHCARVVEKLRQQQLQARRVVVFIHTNRFREDLAQYAQSIEVRLIHPSDDIRLITRMAKEGLARVFKPGFHYKKAGVCLEELLPKSVQQIDLFNPICESDARHTEQLMTAMEGIHKKYGRGSIRLAAEGHTKPWAMRSELKSPAYTTRWSDLPGVF
jgi:DNA polymerase V